MYFFFFSFLDLVGMGGGGVFKMVVLEGDCEDLVFDFVKSCNLGLVIGIMKWFWLMFYFCLKILKYD